MNESTQFLQDWLPDGPWSVGAIDPDDAKGIAWLTSLDLYEVETFIEVQASLNRNCYFQINLQRPDLGTNRASKADAVAGIAIHAEIDPPAEGTPESLAEWQFTQGSDFTSKEYWVTKGLPFPSLVTFTGSGFLVAWKLAHPVMMWEGEPLAQSPLQVEYIESRNRFLVEKLGADSASTDVSRLLRLPYSINIPNESKRAKGRTDNVPSEVLHFDPLATHGLGLFKMQPKVEGSSEYTERKIDFVGAPSKEKWSEAVSAIAEVWPHGQRHQAQLALSGALARLSWPEELIVDFLVDVAEADESGNGDRAKRQNTVKDTLSNYAADKHTWGWPALVGFVGKEALDKCTAALGLNHKPVADPDFVSNLTSFASTKLAQEITTTKPNPVAPQLEVVDDTGPSHLDIVTALKAAQRNLSKKRLKDLIKDAALLKKVLNGDPLVDDIDEDAERAFGEAVIAVVKYAPEGSSVARLCKVMMSSAGNRVGNLPDTVVKVQTYLQTKAKEDNSDEFELEIQGSKTGQPKAGSLHNFAVILRRMGVKLRFDEFSNKKLITYGDAPEDKLSDKHTINIRVEAERQFKFEVPKDKFLDYINDCAWSNSFHPVRDYLDALPVWDGVPRVETWLIDCGQAEDTPYTRAVSRLVLTAAVRRIRQPGCKFDEMMILEGEQGSSKSKFLKLLVPNTEWFSDEFPLNADSKTVIERTRGKWIMEAGELKGMNTAENSSLKSQLSRTDDESRMAYGRETESVKRAFIIIGTTNDSKYLKDPTGDRRYWPVSVGIFDTRLLLKIRDQLWAEANLLDVQNPDEDYIRLDPSLYAAAAEQQSQRRIEDLVEDRLVGIIGDNNGIILADDVYRCLGLDGIPSKAENTRVNNAMQAMKFVSERRRIGNNTLRVWVRGNVMERNIRLTLIGNPITGWEITKPKETTADATN